MQPYAAACAASAEQEYFQVGCYHSTLELHPASSIHDTTQRKWQEHDFREFWVVASGLSESSGVFGINRTAFGNLRASSPIVGTPYPPTAPPLTMSFASLFAPAARSASTTAEWHSSTATTSGVCPPCGKGLSQSASHTLHERSFAPFSVFVPPYHTARLPVVQVEHGQTACTTRNIFGDGCGWQDSGFERFG